MRSGIAARLVLSRAPFVVVRRRRTAALPFAAPLASVLAPVLTTVLVAALASGCDGCGAAEPDPPPAAAADPAERPAEHRLALGRGHTCVIVGEAGRVRCWGDNRDRQLGLATPASASGPVDVPVGGVRGLSAASEVTCAVRVDGAVHCWGLAADGRLGRGPLVGRQAPGRVDGVERAVEVAVGAHHACARTEEGRVLCWGRNREGQLGDGTAQARSRAVPVAGIRGASDLAIGRHESCVVEDGRVRCWGRAAGRILAAGAGSTPRPPPQQDELTVVDVPGIGDAIAVTLGSGSRLHGCALEADGAVACWGANACGQSRGATSTGGDAPAAIEGVEDAVAVRAGGRFTCALAARGRVLCWGCTPDGERRPAPTGVPGVTAVSIEAGERHACVITPRGLVQCWGHDRFGQSRGRPPAREPGDAPVGLQTVEGASG